MSFLKEIERRRTFGIISHPDAGKTTLTEKLLLFGGAIQEAGAVKNNKIKKGATSDFMEIERQRGISVATSVLAFNYKDKKIDGKTFLEFIDKQQKSGLTTKPISKLVEALYDKFLDEQLKVYYDDNLETEFVEFANVMEEYRDGLLLFDLMEKEIWEKAKTDTVGLQKFYNDHKMEHLWKNRVEATILSSTKMDMIKKALALLKKKTEPQKIKEKLNVDAIINVMANTGVFEEGSDALPKATKYEVGISDIFKEGEYYFVLKVDKLLPAGVKTLEECKGKIINDYQQYLEKGWVDDLKQEFTVKINKDVFEKVKKQLNP